MAERVPKITQAEKPTFDARAYSDRLQEGRVDPVPRDPALAFDKASRSSIVSLAEYVKLKLTDTVNALSDFTAAHENRLNGLENRLDDHNRRLNKLEAARRPFG